MKKPALALLVMVIISVACSSSGNAEPTLDVNQIAVETIMASGPTLPPAPTETQPPTSTPPPTNTPLPTATNTPLPQPIVLTGSGDSIVDIQKWDGPALLQARYTGGGNFIIRNYPANGTEYIDLLVNIIGAYEGLVPLDLFDDEFTARLEIKASGPWEIQVLPFETIKKVSLPATYNGKGDDIFALVGGTPDTIKADASQARSNFIVQGIDSRQSLIFNEIAPYTGTAILDPETFILIIHAEGPWTLEISTR